MTARTATSTAEMARTLTGRLTALARAHDLIRPAITQDVRYAASADLYDLVKAVLSPHLSSEENQIRIDGTRIEIGPTAGTAFALIMHELATNAVKYGALSVPEGRVEIAWKMIENQLTFSWAETGGPLITDMPERVGFGSQLSRVSARGQLGGDIAFDWQPAGLQIRLTASLDRLQH